MSMDYRIWIAISEMPFKREERWLPVMAHLESRHPSLGPVASWDDASTMIVVLSGEASNQASAAKICREAVNDALRATVDSDRVPSVIRIDSLTDSLAA